MNNDLPLFDRIDEEPEAPRPAPPARAFVPAFVPADLPDSAARAFAVDPLENVILEASAGTGKTRVLVDRYLNLLRAGVEPQRILAITFTRKAASEMRERILRAVQQDPKLWDMLRDRLGEVSITTIDSFCLGLLREFPLEANLDPAFDVADETEVPRLIDEALDATMRIGMVQADTDPEMALVLAQLGAGRTRNGLAKLLERRLVADEALERFLDRAAGGPLTLDQLSARAIASLGAICARLPGWPDAFLASGPVKFAGWPMIARQLGSLGAIDPKDHAAVRRVMDAARTYFLKSDGAPVGTHRTKPLTAKNFARPEDGVRHFQGVQDVTRDVHALVEQHAASLNVMLTRGVRKFYRIALNRYRRALDERSALDFSELLARALGLFREMEDFARSRYLLEQRYQHVLVDEFQDTSRAQWDLVSELVKAWGEGAGLAAESGPIPPSIFIVGDRKQSIYRFRDADVTVIDRAAEFIARLRQGTGTGQRRAINTSMRAVPALQAFINDLFTAVDKADIRTAFTYGDTDRFPIEPAEQIMLHDGQPVVGIVADESPELTAERIADEIVRLLTTGTVRDRDTGMARRAKPGDIAILFRTRASHKEIEAALEARSVPTYVYKGLGFFESDEVRDLLAILRFLAQPESDARAAALLRSRFFRVSDAALQRLTGRLAAALTSPDPIAALDALDVDDRTVIDASRALLQRWLPLVDRLPPAELLDGVLDETAYLYEIAGPRERQARENVKKFRSMIRRIQNRGYATLARIASHVDRLYAGDESNAAIEAIDAVNLMTAHAAKGLEFPIVFVVSLTKSSGGMPPAVRVVLDDDEGERVWVGPFASDDDKTGERKRETEETKRLLYVALTRARDRLYLGTVLKDGRAAAGNGSLAKVLPDGFVPLFELAGRGDPEASWTTGARIYPFRVCPPPEVPLLTLPLPAQSAARPADFSALAIDGASVAASVTGAKSARDINAFVPAGDRLLGTLVHRMLQRGVDAAADPERLVNDARALALDDELAAVEDAEAAVREAAAAFRVIALREDVRTLLASGERLHEVPFSLRREGRVLRGSIDCLILRAGKSGAPASDVVVVEFKTGRKRAEHQEQLEAYVAAARELFPGAAVSGVLVYP